MGGREAFHLSKGVASSGMGAFPALGPNAPPFSGAGETKGPNACTGFASRWAGETLSVFQKASPRWAWGVPFPPSAPTPCPFRGWETRGPNACPGFASRWAGERLSTFQKASPRRARRAFPIPGPNASPFSGAGGKEPSACPGFASRWAGRFPSFKRRRPAGRGGSFPARPRRLALFVAGNEGTEFLHGFCFPPGGVLSISQKTSPRQVWGPFPLLAQRPALFGTGNEGAERPPATFPPRPRRPALYGSRGKKEPNVWPGRASSAGSRGSRRAGRVHSTFQAVSSRRAQRMNFR